MTPPAGEGAPHVVGQAVVTDPGGDSAGGYVLVAASPSVRADEGHFLKRCSGISEHLHRSERPGPYFTFLPLPKSPESRAGRGNHALIRRFVAGRRRGVHRVVVHMLVVPEPLLDALDWDATLLSTHCRYSPVGAAASDTGSDTGSDTTGEAAGERLSDLGKAAAADRLQELPDLRCSLPEAAAGAVPAARVEAQRQRIRYLQREWGEPALLATLGWTFHTLLTGQGALLPQALPYQQLLTLAAASLPRRDRRRLAWSTHFAAGVRADFRLLNAPQPEEARRMQAEPSSWQCRPRELPEVDATSTKLGPALAWVVLHEPDLLEAFEAGWRDWSPSLLYDAGRAQRFLAWLRGDARGAREGFASLDELGAFLRACRDGWGGTETERDPWLSGTVLLRATLRTALVLAAGTAPRWDGLLRGTQEQVDAAGWGDTLTPVSIAGALLDTFQQAADSGRSAELMEQAIVPMLGAAPERVRELASVLASLRGAAMSATGRGELYLVELYQELADLIVSVLELQPEQATAALAALLQADGVRVLDWHSELDAWLQVLARLGRPELASRLAGCAWLRLREEVGLREEAGLPEEAWDSFPKAALRSLDVLQAESLRSVLDAWRPRLEQLGGKPGEVALVKALRAAAGQLDPRIDAKAQFDFELEIQRLRVVRGERSTGSALRRLDDLAADLSARRGHAFALPGDELLCLFPRAPVPCCEALLQALLSGATRPSVKWSLQGQWPKVLARLERGVLEDGAAAPDLGWLPVPAKLAGRGRVFLTTSRWLGRNWDIDPVKAADYLSFALQRREFAAVQAFLDASRRHLRDGSVDDGWLRHLVEVEPNQLPQQLQIVVGQHGAAALRFGRHVDRLIELGNTGA